MAVSTRLAAPSGLHVARIGHRILGLVATLGLGFAAIVLVCPGPAMAGDCEVSVEQQWPDGLVAAAFASGECGLASLDLVVRNGVDEVVWSGSYQSGELMGFDDIADPDSLRVAMEDWLGPYADTTTSGRLPDWPEGADQPDAGEFPFYVEDGLSQQDYEELRAGDYPMICYIQGRESTLCLVRHPGVSALISVGAQSFPG